MLLPSRLDWFDWLALAILFVLTLMFLGEAWVNIVQKKVSSFSIDGLIVFLGIKFGTRKIRENSQAFSKKKAEIIFFGICALLAGLRGVYEIYSWIIKYGSK